jgi:hypothetical protein
MVQMIGKPYSLQRLPNAQRQGLGYSCDRASAALRSSHKPSHRIGFVLPPLAGLGS